MSSPWYASAAFRTVALWSAGLFIVGFGIDSIFIRDNDFQWHREVGRVFLAADEVLVPASACWYPLGRRMMDAALVALPYRVSRAAVYVLSLACFAAAIRCWRRMSGTAAPDEPATSFAAAALSLVFLAPHLSRDLQECGLQLLLLAVLTAAGYALWLGQPIRAGFWLALGITYKTTPILFVPVLLWKRQWRATAATVAFVVALNLLPALYLGWDLTLRAHRTSWEHFQAAATLPDIAENGVEPPNPRNLGLMSLFSRYLQTYPAEHPLYVQHWAFAQFGNLDHDTARLAARCGMLLLGALVAWRLWGTWTVRSPNLPAQWAAICVFAALLSPLCWRQHLVLVWPALFLLVGSLLGRPLASMASRWAWILMSASVVLLWAPQNEVIGSEWTTILLASKLDTVIFLIWALVLLRRCGPTVGAPEATAPAPLEAAWSRAA
jgi:alpha-1,2-mannosyltransferase